MSSPVHVTDHSFDAEVLKCDIPVLAEFWAEWSKTCQQMEPDLLDIAREYVGRLKVVRLDIEANPVVTAQYHVLNVPTLILFKFGQEVERITGQVSKTDLVAKITPYLNG